MSNGEVLVYERRCDRCLFGPRPLFPPAAARRLRAVALAKAEGIDVICHRASDRGRSVLCPGFVAVATQAGVDVLHGRTPVVTGLEPNDPRVDQTEAEAAKAVRAVEEGFVVFFDSRIGDTVVTDRLTKEDAARIR